MHCHLSSCMRDYGPLHGFWLYAFERYNGLLGSLPNNNRSIEIQLMRRFLRDNQILSSPFEDEFASDFSSLFPGQKTAGSISDTLSPESLSVTINSPSFANILAECELVFPKHCTRHMITSNQKHSLVELYTELKSVSRSAIEISSTHEVFICTYQWKANWVVRYSFYLIMYCYGYMERRVIWECFLHAEQLELNTFMTTINGESRLLH